jgi:hypothetical protein
MRVIIKCVHVCLSLKGKENNGPAGRGRESRAERSLSRGVVYSAKKNTASSSPPLSSAAGWHIIDRPPYGEQMPEPSQAY